jgi:FtsH-binding integral membrane protein
MFKNEFSNLDSIEIIDYSSNPGNNTFIRFIRLLFSFELLFTLFLFAWVYKADPIFEQIPIDLTQLFFILSVCSGILVCLAEKKKFGKKAAVIVLPYFACFTHVFHSSPYIHI